MTMEGTITIGDQTFEITQAEAKPKISTPSSVVFGKLKLKMNKATTATKTITIKNTGDASLIIGTAGIADTVGVFSITKDKCSSQTIAKKKTCAITVKFSSQTAGTYNGALSIPSNDQDAATATVPLTGSM